MPKITEHLAQFTEALLNKETIECDWDGSWKKVPTCQKITNFFIMCRSDAKRLNKILRVFEKIIDDWEKIPVQFSDDESVINAEKKRYAKYLKAIDALMNYVGPNSDYKLTNKILRKKVGLEYRIGSTLGGLNESLTSVQNLILHVSLQGWKKSQLYPEKDKKINSEDYKQLQTIARHKEFTDLLLHDAELMNQIFKWSIRDGNDPVTFIQFPNTCDKLSKFHISKRTGILDSDALRIEYNSNQEKCLTLKFNGQRINILDDNIQITLDYHLKLKLKDIYQIFSKKNGDVGQVEYFGPSGFLNWHGEMLASYDPTINHYVGVNLDETNWWEELPSFQVLKKSELEKKYKLNLKPGEWLTIIRGTRETFDFMPNGRHGFLEVMIPGENDTYAAYPFGRFTAGGFPEKILEQAALIIQTVPGAIIYPDLNPIYTHRQHALFPIKMPAAKGRMLMGLIKEDILKARKGQLFFQLGGENCAGWVDELFERLEGQTSNFFRVPFFSLRSNNLFLNMIFTLPKPLQHALLFTFMVGAEMQGVRYTENGLMFYKKTQFHFNPDDNYQYDPGKLATDIETKKISGILRYGK